MTYFMLDFLKNILLFQWPRWLDHFAVIQRSFCPSFRYNLCKIPHQKTTWKPRGRRRRTPRSLCSPSKRSPSRPGYTESFRCTIFKWMYRIEVFI